MRILINSINYAPELTGIGKYTAEMAEWYRGQGHDVRIVTAPPYYPAWKVAPGFRSWSYARQVVNGINVIRCPLWVPGTPGGLKRIFHLLSFALTSLPVIIWYAATWRPKLIMTIEPPLFCAPGVWIASRIAGADSWLHVQDFEVDAAFSLGVLKSGLLRILASGVERFFMRRFDIVSTISSRMLARIHGKGVVDERTLYMPNWVDTNAIRPLPNSDVRRADFGLPGHAIIFLYAGNMGEKQGVELIVEAARILAHNRQSRQNDVYFVLCGEGSARARLERDAAGLTNLCFMALQPAARFNALLNCADVHLLPQKGDAEDLVMPSKLTAMLASGRPVIATAKEGTEIAEVVEGRGLLVAPGDAVVLATAIGKLATDKLLRDTLGANARRYALANFEKHQILQAAFQEYLSRSEPEKQVVMVADEN